jgi:hypothetical protein
MKRLKKYVYDVDYRGRMNDNGGLRYLWGEDALNQAIKLWIASFQGEIVRQPGRGGYITYWILQPMNDDNAERVQMSIQDGFYQDFTPYLEIQTLKVAPNYEQRYWHIYMEVYSNTLKLSTTVDEKIKAKVTG